MLKVYSEPTLRRPVLLCAFAGWADAATAASGALRYLLLKRPGQRFAEFDPDSIYCYTVTRPVTLLEGRAGRRLQWPELSWTVIEVPEAPRDLIVLVGPEPDLRWRQCVHAIGGLASKLGVSRIIAFGAYLGQVHYASPPSMMGVSFDPTVRTQMRRIGLSQSDYQGPTSFVTAILSDAHDRGIPAASVWVAAPSYLSGTSNPKLAAALLRTAEQMIGQSLWREELEAAGRDMEQRIDEALKERPDLMGFLSKLSVQPESPQPSPPQEEPEATPGDGEQELPSAEEVLRDLEEHLRRLKGDSDQGTGE